MAEIITVLQEYGLGFVASAFLVYVAIQYVETNKQQNRLIEKQNTVIENNSRALEEFSKSNDHMGSMLQLLTTQLGMNAESQKESQKEHTSLLKDHHVQANEIKMDVVQIKTILENR